MLVQFRLSYPLIYGVEPRFHFPTVSKSLENHPHSADDLDLRALLPLVIEGSATTGAGYLQGRSRTGGTQVSALQRHDGEVLPARDHGQWCGAV